MSTAMEAEYHSESEIQQKYKTLRETFNTGKTIPIAYRRKQLLQLARAFQDNADAITLAAREDNGRPDFETVLAETGPIIQAALRTADKLPEWTKPSKPHVEEEWRAGWDTTLYDVPKGVCLVLGPWNWPLVTTMLMVGIHGVCITVGYCSSSWAGFGFYFAEALNGAQWRVPLAIQAIPPLFLAVGVLFLPESPRWLISRSRSEEALKIVQKLHRDESDPHNMFAYREYQQICQQYEIDKNNEVSWKEMFMRPSYRKRLIIGFTVMFASQTTGTTVINNYGPELYGALGFDSAKQLLIGACWITLALCGNCFNALTLDKVGRVRALQIGWIGDWFALIGECVALSTYQRTQTRPAAIASVAFLFIHIFFFSFNVDATSYVYVSEIFPTHIRAKGMAMSISGYFLSLLIYLEVSPTAFDNIGWKFYIVFLVGITCFIIPTFFYYPETKGLPLEEINRLFNDQAADVNLYAPEGVTEKEEQVQMEEVPK